MSWPNGVIPYIFSDDYSQNEKDLISEAMNLITTKTSGCIKFVEPSPDHVNWIEIYDNGINNSSLIGSRKTGGQKLSLLRSTLALGTIVHELCHTIGLLHEHTRPDRDDHVTVDYDNIHEPVWRNFSKDSSFNTYDTPYDCHSIMHYQGNAMAKNPRSSTITPKDDSIELLSSADKKAHQILTKNDIIKIQRMYNFKEIPDQENGTTTVVTANLFTLVNDHSQIVYLYKFVADKFAYQDTIIESESKTKESGLGERWEIKTFDKDTNEWTSVFFTVGHESFKESDVTISVNDFIGNPDSEPIPNTTTTAVDSILSQFFGISLNNDHDQNVYLYKMTEAGDYKFLKTMIPNSDHTEEKSEKGEKWQLKTFSHDEKTWVDIIFTSGEGLFTGSGVKASVSALLNAEIC